MTHTINEIVNETVNVTGETVNVTMDETIKHAGNKCVTSDETLNETISEKINETINEAVLRLDAARPGLTAQRLIAASGKSRATVMRAIAALQREGKVEHRGSKKTGGYYPTGR